MSKEFLESLKTYFLRNKKNIVEDLQTLLAFKTISANPETKDEFTKCSQWLSNKLEQLGAHTEIWGTTFPIVYARLPATQANAPTLLIYAHYDVQPVDPLSEWERDPFQPSIEDNTIYGRGASDDKSQCIFILTALEYLSQIERPCHIKVIFDGEEEIASKTLETIALLKEEELQSEYTMIIDFGFREKDVPVIPLGTRGITALSITAHGPNQDLHSGSQGGLAHNPIHALISMLNSLRNPDGSIAVPGFYDDVYMPSEDEKKRLHLSFDEKEWELQYGQLPTGGEHAFSPLERSWTRPTLEINGIAGGYSGPGIKTIIPSQASAKISCRLVPNQDPHTIAKGIQQFLKNKAPKGIDISIDIFEGSGKSFRTPINTGIQALARAMHIVWNRQAEYVFEGGSIPIIPLLQQATKGEIIPWGVGLSTDRIHAPNEHFDLTRLEQGFLTLSLTIAFLGKKS